MVTYGQPYCGIMSAGRRGRKINKRNPVNSSEFLRLDYNKMILNIIGVGSFLYMMSAFIGCTPHVRTKINPVYQFIKGGCPYNQTTRSPTSLKVEPVAKI